MHAKRGVYIAVFLIFVLNAAAVDYTVTREISTTDVVVGGTISITLSVDVGNSDAFAIDETVPNGWTVQNAGGGSQDHAGHLKWVVVGESGSSGYDCGGLDSCTGSIQDVSYTYILKAPSTTGSATLTGEYMFDTDSIVKQIGSTTLTVVDNECIPYNADSAGCNAQTACSYCPMASQCLPASQVACTTSGCYDENSVCNSECQIVACGSNEKCKTTQCEVCNPDWVCGSWYPDICPASSKFERDCTDNNNCQTAKTESKRCTPNSGTPTGNSTGGGRPPSGGTADPGSSGTVPGRTRPGADNTTDPGTTTTTSGRTRDSGSSTDTPSVSTGRGDPIDTTSSGGSRPTVDRTADTAPKSDLEELEEESNLSKILMWVLGLIMIGMLIGGVVYYMQGHAQVHPGNVQMPRNMPGGLNLNMPRGMQRNMPPTQRPGMIPMRNTLRR